MCCVLDSLILQRRFGSSFQETGTCSSLRRDVAMVKPCIGPIQGGNCTCGVLGGIAQLKYPRGKCPGVQNLGRVFVY